MLCAGFRKGIAKERKRTKNYLSLAYAVRFMVKGKLSQFSDEGNICPHYRVHECLIMVCL
jgi:hypothetical protein